MASDYGKDSRPVHKNLADRSGFWILVIVVAILIGLYSLFFGNSDASSSSSYSSSSGYSSNSGYVSEANAPVQSSFRLENLECSSWTSGSGSSLSGYVMPWKSGSSTDNYWNGGKYVRLTGTINLPASRNGMRTQEYFTSDEIPIQLHPDFEIRFYSNASEAQAATTQLRSRMTSTIRSELSRLASSQDLFVLKIYGDGRLLYTSPSLYTRSSPVTFSVDVAGVNNVEFVWSYAYMNYGADYYGRTIVSITDLYGHTN